MYYTEMDGHSYPAIQHIHQLDGSKVVTWSRSITSANLLEVEAGTNGYQGGDAGHGCRTYLRFQDEGGTDMKCRTLTDRYGNDEGFELILGGDCELQTTIEALKWMISVLETQSETGR